jgi:hypothetical protein
VETGNELVRRVPGTLTGREAGEAHS